MADYRFPRGPDGAPTPDSHSCAEWRVLDRDGEANPLQFFPNYMRCLIDYGRFLASRKLPQWQADDAPGAFGG
jgi:hypothetical protein